VCALLISDLDIARYIASGRSWHPGDWPLTGGVLSITAAAWTAGLQWWSSGDITLAQNVSEYMLVLALHLVNVLFSLSGSKEFELLCKNYSVVHTHGQFHACVWHSYVVQPVFRLTFVLHLTYSFLCMFSIRLVRHCIA